MRNIPEKDWKLLRKLQDEKLDTACGQILEEIESAIKSKGNENRKAYRKVFEIVESGDRKIAEMFDDPRRSNAIFKLLAWRRNGILSDEELRKFTDETREVLQHIAETRR